MSCTVHLGGLDVTPRRRRSPCWYRNPFGYDLPAPPVPRVVSRPRAWAAADALQLPVDDGRDTAVDRQLSPRAARAQGASARPC